MKLALLILSAAALLAQGTKDYYPRRANVQTSLPATCNVGEEVFLSTAPAGQNKYGCTAANTWTLMGGGSAGLAAVATSSTLLSVTAGSCQIGTVSFSKAASTGTLSGSSASSTVYAYCDNAGTLTLGHNGAATLTCSGCTTATGITDFPVDSVPLFTAVYTSNVWGTITSKIPTARRDNTFCGTGTSCSYDAAGNLTITNTATAAVTPTYPYLPWGFTGGGSLNFTAVFTANQTRWQFFYLPGGRVITGIRSRIMVVTPLPAGSKGLRYAIADSTGAILYKTPVCNDSNTAGNENTCAFTSPITLTAGNYYVGITTDSTDVQWEQAIYLGGVGSAYCTHVDSGISPGLFGVGTIGTGTGNSVDFGASMGSLTQWSCNSGANTFVTGFIQVWFY